MAGDEKSPIVVDRRQVSFYGGFGGEPRLDPPSRSWRRFRRRVKSVASVPEQPKSCEAGTFAPIRPRRVPEVGCRDGRAATLAPIRQLRFERSVGIDLSPGASDRCRSELSTRHTEKVELLGRRREAGELRCRLHEQWYFIIFQDPEHIVPE